METTARRGLRKKSLKRDETERFGCIEEKAGGSRRKTETDERTTYERVTGTL
jgi:hypothetical protein